MRRDLYGVLGLHPSSEDVVIRAAYRVLAQRFHPDKRPGNDRIALARMQEINEAYAILSDAKRRSEYDRIHRGSGAVDVAGACAQTERRIDKISAEIDASDLRNRTKLNASFLAVQEFRRGFATGRILAVA
jgi:curved DNA-binding protein CbpA